MESGVGEPSDIKEELVAAAPSNRNWKGIIISLVVILAVIGLVALSVIWLTPPDPGPRVKGERLRLDTILSGKFKPNPYNATWISGSLLAYINAEGGLSTFDINSRSHKLLLDNSTFRLLNSYRYKICSSMNYILIVHNYRKVFRYSSTGQYTLQPITKNKSDPLHLVKISVSPSFRSSNNQELLQFVDFIPRDRGLIAVAGNDIFYLPELDGKTVHRITDTGTPSTIYNGVADWLYEEEILGQSNAIWMSPEGTRILFASFNDSDVSTVTLREYGGIKENTSPNSIYPRQKTLRYPKAGTTNPTVTLYVHVLQPDGNGETMVVKPPPEIAKSDHYFCSVSWLSEETVSVLWMNRAQNKSVYTMCFAANEFTCKQILVETTADNGGGWVENRGLPKFSPDEKKMVLVQPIMDGDFGHFNQIVQGDVSTDHRIPNKQLTHGRFEVTEILSWDTNKQIVYYMATLPDKPGERHLFALNLTDNDSVICLTQTQKVNQKSKGTPVDCQYSRIHLSPSHEAYVQECLGPSIPSTHIFSLPSNTLILTLDDNRKVHDVVKISSMPRSKLVKGISLPGGFKARVHLTIPPVLREHEEFQFPLVVNIYGGPGTQKVSSRWSVDWDTYLASQKDFIVATMDVRGSGFQGNKLKHAVYRQLGTAEVEDTLHVIKELSKLKYVDASKIAVWGWSYGGFLAGSILAQENIKRKDKGLISCAIAVAPVTQWHNYDSAYTERYMGFPTASDNWNGYQASSLVLKSNLFPDSKLMVVHGTADDNVHIQHTMILSKNLVKHGVIFRQQVYPDENHSLYGVTKHQHETMEAFLDDTFGPMHDYFKDDYYLAAANLLAELPQTDHCYMC